MLYPTPIAKLIDSFQNSLELGLNSDTPSFYTISMSDEDVNDFAKTSWQQNVN